MTKVALVIVYNHQYNKNIEILEQIYKDRFSDIYHLVPFYNGDKSNVIPVYDSSFYFQGYIAQGLKSFFKEKYEHYFFIADDLILNPIINERNYCEHLKLGKNTCFLPGFITLHDRNEWWSKTIYAADYTANCDGVEAQNQLPSYKVFSTAFQHFGLDIKPIGFDKIWKKPVSIRDFGRTIIRDRFYFFRKIKNKITKKQYGLAYPLVGSYSDIFVVSSDSIKQFCHYCGVFAATKLFVEIGLPTSLVLSAQEIITEKDLELQGKALWPDGWGRLTGDLKLARGDYDELKSYGNNLNDFLNNFPKDYLYLHPIKLSKWNTKL